jgi:hypothetical protein
MVRYDTVKSKELYFFSCLLMKLGMGEVCGSGIIIF